MPHIKVLIVDDNAGFRKHLRQVLDAALDLEVVGEAVDGCDAVQKVHALHPHLVLMDIRMPRMNGITAAQILKQEEPDIKIIILTMFDEQEYRHAVRRNGADGYVVKKDMFSQLLPTIEQCCSNSHSCMNC